MRTRTFLILALLLAFLSGGIGFSLFAADTSYQAKVYHKQGGDEEVVADGGAITVESGGDINVEAGGAINNDGIYTATPVTLTYTEGTGFSIAATDSGHIFEAALSTVTGYADTDNCPSGPVSVGVTAWVFAPTADTHGRIIGIRNTSGTTAFIVRAIGDVPVGTTSGVTRSGGEDVGDITWLQANCGGAVSWWVVGEFKND